MPKERVPEHPDDVRQRREALIGLIMAFGIVLFAFGVIALVTATGTESAFAGSPIPADVQAAADSARFSGFLMMIVGGSSTGLGLCVWLFVKAPEQV